MKRCSVREWIPMLPWPVWPPAGQCALGQNMVVGSMIVLLALYESMPRGGCREPHFCYKRASPRFSGEPPDHFDLLQMAINGAHSIPHPCRLCTWHTILPASHQF